jgi:Transposase, Mutator family
MALGEAPQPHAQITVGVCFGRLVALRRAVLADDVGRPVAARGRAALGACERLGVAATGLPVSPGDLPQRPVLELLVGHDLLELAVLALELLEPTALRDVWPETREQPDWVHKVANVLDALPKSAQPTAKKMLAEIRDAEDREHAAAAKRFDAEFRARWPKAADKIASDLDRLLTFLDFPAQHWLHLETSNPIESTFSTVRLRTKVTKGPGSRAAGLAMALKLIESAQDQWRALNGAPPRCPRACRRHLQ